MRIIKGLVLKRTGQQKERVDDGDGDGDDDVKLGIFDKERRTAVGNG